MQNGRKAVGWTRRGDVGHRARGLYEVDGGMASPSEAVKTILSHSRPKQLSRSEPSLMLVMPLPDRARTCSC